MQPPETKEEALAIVQSSPVRAGQRWRHFKTGGVYVIIAVGLLESTLDPVVTYTGPDGVAWTRLLAVFSGRAVVDGAHVQRFSLIG